MWLPRDRQLALAWVELQNEKCPGCGQLTSDSLDPEQADRWVPHLVRCNACEAKDRLYKSYGEKGDLTGIKAYVSDR